MSRWSRTREALGLAHRTVPIEGPWATLQSAGVPLLVGLVLMATDAAVVGHVLVSLLWRKSPMP